MAVELIFVRGHQLALTSAFGAGSVLGRELKAMLPAQPSQNQKINCLDWCMMSHLLSKEWPRTLVIDQIFQYKKFSI